MISEPHTSIKIQVHKGGEMSSSSSVTTEAGESAHEEPLPGFRFFPTPEVLVSFYLKMKIEGQDSTFKHLIRVIDVSKIEPWDIPAFLGEPDVSDPEKLWFFFTRPVQKYNNSTRCSRTTDRGFYKMQGKEHDVKARQSKEVVGKKKNFTFYRGRPRKNAEKDDWFLDEYSLPGAEKLNFVLCCLKKGPATSKKLKEVSMCDRLSDSSSGEAGGGHIAYNYEDDQAAAAADMNLDSVEDLAPKERGDVLNGNGNHEDCESPNGSCLSNDVSTCDDENDVSIFSGLDFQAALHKKFDEYSALVKGDVDRERLHPSDPPQPYSPPQPFEPPHPPQQPQPQDYCSSKLPSPHTSQANVHGVYYGDGSKDYFQPIDNLGFCSPEFQLQNFPLMSPMN